jgi:hypothetical protein
MAAIATASSHSLHGNGRGGGEIGYRLLLADWRNAAP